MDLNNYLNDYLPQIVNTGHFLTAYTLPRLRELIERERVVLPIASLGESFERIAELAPLVLPPLYHEALDDDLKTRLLDRIRECFPYYRGSTRRAATRCQLEVVELPARSTAPPRTGGVAAFSVDTAVEEHGPHLPLCTDTIQSYGALARLCAENDQLWMAPPVEYGQLTWGLPFGLSIDITPELTTEYTRQYANAICDWAQPDSLYVVDVHGSIVHRTAIQDGLRASECARWSFRWLHDPLVEFAGERGDQHAGGVETAIVELIDERLIDRAWFPSQSAQIQAEQMNMAEAIELSTDLDQFVARVENGPPLNGVVGVIENYGQVDGQEMMDRILAVARQDLSELAR
ncbi:MAG: creatininase family protein [Pirellulaceae bacterium]|jgi:creatinine amidohydrolase/Fe(II)-dependent formamide hydrolase-like protein|nr:creatininase family protein [Pirellulaceae bacterium]MDP7016895.1 creatininase family protein [Pirellulaceae bacterium]